VVGRRQGGIGVSNGVVEYIISSRWFVAFAKR
jgi:hypothetical protein